jgi:hypothetical protein
MFVFLKSSFTSADLWHIHQDVTLVSSQMSAIQTFHVFALDAASLSSSSRQIPFRLHLGLIRQDHTQMDFKQKLSAPTLVWPGHVRNRPRGATPSTCQEGPHPGWGEPERATCLSTSSRKVIKADQYSGPSHFGQPFRLPARTGATVAFKWSH